MSFEPLVQEVGVSGAYLAGFWWLCVCALVAWLAHQKGQNPLLFFVVTAILSPVVGLPAIIAARDLKKAAEDEAAHETFRQMMGPLLLQIDGIRGHIAVSNDTARTRLPEAPPATQSMVPTPPRAVAAAAGS
jgi:hypothetical protein